ncbi:37374_t:CDS:1, partial [Gigaspora margarita]
DVSAKRSSYKFSLENSCSSPDLTSLRLNVWQIIGLSSYKAET